MDNSPLSPRARRADSTDPAARDAAPDRAEAVPTEAETSETVHESGAEHRLPGLDRLLSLSHGGDHAAFAAFYDATAPMVHGLAASMFASPEDAFEATVLTYLQVWDRAGEEVADAQETEAVRHRSVLNWLLSTAHRTMTALLRHNALPGLGEDLLPDDAGAAALADAAPRGALSALTPAQFAALTAAWAGGRTYRELAEELQITVPTAKSRLRDGVQRLSHRYQDEFLGGSGPVDPVMMRAVTPEIAARTGRQRNFTTTLEQDLDNGLGRELADLCALDAVDDSERATLEAHIDEQGPENTTVWRGRLEASRRTVTWAFSTLAQEPPSDLLDELLHRLPAQDVGMDLVDGMGHRGEEPEQPAPPPPLKKWMLVAAGLLVLVVGILAIWRLIAGPDVVGAVDGAQDSFVSAEHPLSGGGTVQAHVSREADMAYLDFAEVAAEPEGQDYQVWLHPRDGSAPASLGTFSAQDLEDPVTVRGLSQYEDLSVTLEPEAGSERPTAAPVVTLSLVHQVTQGPQYGGSPNHPTTSPSPSE